VATLAELRAQEAKLATEIRAASERVRNAATDEEARAAQEERQRLRNQLEFISADITRIELSSTTNFVIIPDNQTGGFQIRTADGLFAGAGPDLESAKAAAISNGASASALNNLPNPQTTATADQGPKTDSAAAQVESQQPTPTTSESTVATNAQPTTPLGSETTAANADQTNGQVRGIESTQSIPPPTAQVPLSQAQGSGVSSTVGGTGTPVSGSLPGPGPVTQPGSTGAGTQASLAQGTASGARPGVGSGNDDAARGDSASDFTGAGTNAITAITNRTAQPIEPQPNVLDQFISYTYSASIYLMSDQDYSRMLTNKQKYIPGFQLLIQSGGASVSSGIASNSQVNDPGETPTGVSLTAGRNEFFQLDYYLDDIEIRSVLPGKGTGGAHNVTEMKFTITEPNGITLLDNLYRATQQYINQGGGYTQSAANNYAAQNFLMVLRFYGYDAQGNIVTGTAGDAGGDPNKSDPRAIVEKFIPFQFTDIKFKVSNRATEYQCSVTCPQNIVANGQGRGVIPYNIELTATTLQNLFNGNLTFTETQDPNQQTRDTNTQGGSTAPDKANTAPSPTLTTGLTQALNKYQADLVTQGIYDVADRYRIVISHPEIANASIVPPGPLNRKTTPMTNAQTAAQAKDASKQSVDNNAKNVSATAGMSITQFIDLAVRSSDYIYQQQTKIVTTDKNGKQVDVPQSSGAQAFAWYKIGTEVRPINKPDAKRNDKAYEIIYEIAPYSVADIKSEYFPKGRFRGTQKKYNYWFTGENTSVLNFEQDFNYLYYITINSPQTGRSVKFTSDYQEVEKRFFSPNSAQSNQGTEGNVNEPAANAADYLYSPRDQARINMTIVGDPAWIAQGEVWSGVRSLKNVTGSNDAQDPYFSAFLPDGTINFDSGEPLFELIFNKPQDYDLDTGVIGLSQNNSRQQRYVYRGLTVVSRLSKGKFEQDLEGALITFPDGLTNLSGSSATPANAGTQASGTADPNQSTAETNRLQNAAGTTGEANTSRVGGTIENTARVGTGALGNPSSQQALGSQFAQGTYSLNPEIASAVPFKPPENITRQFSTTNLADSVSGTLPAFTGLTGGSAQGVVSAAQNFVPTSFGQTVGAPGAFLNPATVGTAALGAVKNTTVSVQVRTLTGETITIITAGQAELLYDQGRISAAERDRATTELASLVAAQQRSTSTQTQDVRKDP
jgi:hypothetical protein